MPAPILYEVNTRVWLRELSEREGRPVTLADFPDSEIERWKQLGFTHIWLMGIWQVGPKAREVALRFWREHWSQEIPSAPEDVVGSPYAIEEYAVDSRLGDALSVLMLKERLSRAGLRLILDFVPNHLGIDSTEPSRFPARFVHSTEPLPGTFEADARFGRRYFAHGRDPFFDPWLDTVQLDYRVMETHEAMRSVAQTASMYGDGLRCDMAMLLLPEIFNDTWKEFPSPAAHLTNGDFWRKTIQAVRQLQPQVELIAEVYWDCEEQLQELGFDYTYNKRVCDYLVRGQHRELLQLISGCSRRFLERSVHFIENHDEARAASVLGFEQHKLAAAVTLFLPGMALLHDGQLDGRKHFARIQMTQRVPEAPDPQISRFYEELLDAIKKTNVRQGKPNVRHLPGDQPVLAVEWAGAREIDLAVVNFDSQPAHLIGRTEQVLYSSAPSTPAPGQGRVVVPPQSAVIIRLASDRI
jgi:glycosidase